MRWSCAPRSARGSGTSGRTRTPTRYGRPSTCSSGPSRSARVRTASTTGIARLGRPCLYAHIEKCAAPCVGEIDADDYRRLVADLVKFLDGDTSAVLAALDERMRERGGRSRVRAGGATARPGRVGSSGRRAPADGRHPRGGLRPHRDRGRRLGGLGPGLPRAARAHGGAQGSGRGSGRRRRHPGARRPPAGAPLRRLDRGRCSSRDPGTRRARGARAVRGVPRVDQGCEGRGACPPAGRRSESSSRPHATTRPRR